MYDNIHEALENDPGDPTYRLYGVTNSFGDARYLWARNPTVGAGEVMEVAWEFKAEPMEKMAFDDVIVQVAMLSEQERKVLMRVLGCAPLHGRRRK